MFYCNDILKYNHIGFPLIMSKHICGVCDYETNRMDNFQAHASSQKHINAILSQPTGTELICLKCDHYCTNIRLSFRRHIDTCKGVKKHVLSCRDCKRVFQTRSGLSKHVKKCTVETKVNQVIVDHLANIVYDQIRSQMHERWFTLQNTEQNAS
jgi:hypothetical protein